MSMLDNILAAVRNIQSGGVAVPARPTLNFIGAVLADDLPNERTNITFEAATIGDIEALEAQVEALALTVGTLEGSVTSLDGDVATAQADIDAAEASIAANTSNIGTLQTGLGATQTDLDTAEATIATHTASIATNAGNVATNTMNITALQTALAGRVKTRLAIELVTTGSARTLALADFLADENKLLVINSAVNYTLTCPQDSAAAIPIGASLPVLRYHSQTLAIVSGTGATNRPAASVTARAQYSLLVVTKLAGNEWLVTGDMT